LGVASYSRAEAMLLPTTKWAEVVEAYSAAYSDRTDLLALLVGACRLNSPAPEAVATPNSNKAANREDSILHMASLLRSV